MSMSMYMSISMAVSLSMCVFNSVFMDTNMDNLNGMVISEIKSYEHGNSKILKLRTKHSSVELSLENSFFSEVWIPYLN